MSAVGYEHAAFPNGISGALCSGRCSLASESPTAFMLDRILNQVQFAPWIKESYGVDLPNDSEYRRRWCEANLDVFVNGILTSA